MTVTTKRSIIALLLSLVLVVSLFTLGISATDAATNATTEAPATEGTEAPTDETGEAESESDTAAETEVDTSALVEAQKAIDEKKTTLIINGVIIAVIILIIAVVAIRFRKKLGGFLRSVKSEMKKIVWASKENTRKGFLVVFIVAVAFAVVLGLIDFAFQTGISGLAEMFK